MNVDHWRIQKNIRFQKLIETRARFALNYTRSDGFLKYPSQVYGILLFSLGQDAAMPGGSTREG